MFRAFSLLGVVAMAFGFAALASVSSPSQPKKVALTNDRDNRPRRQPHPFVRVPGLVFHASLSAN